MYLLKLMIRPWRREPMGQVFSCLTIGFLSLLSLSLFWIERSLGPVVSELRERHVLTAYLDSQISEKQELEAVDSIKVVLGSASRNVESLSVELVDRHRFLDQIRVLYPELVEELMNLGNDMKTVVPKYISVSGYFPETVVSQVEEIFGVQKAETSHHKFHHSAEIFASLQWLFRAVIFGLILVLFSVMGHLARANIGMQSDAALVLKYWGADSSLLWLIRVGPAVSVALFGATIALVCWIGLSPDLLEQVKSISPAFSGISPLEPQYVYALLPLVVGVGLLSGLWTEMRRVETS